MSLIDRVALARMRVVIEARHLIDAAPGAHPALELALREFYESTRAKALRTAELHSALREPDRDPPGRAA